MFGQERRTSYREMLLSYAAGVFFAVGWWLWIDAHAFSNKYEHTRVLVTFGHYVPGIVSTLGLIMVNVVNWRDLGSSWGSGWGEDAVQARVRAWLFFSLVVCFGGILASIWVASVHWFQQKPTYDWPGLALILQNVAIFVSAMAFRFAKPIDDNAYSAL